MVDPTTLPKSATYKPFCCELGPLPFTLKVSFTIIGEENVFVPAIVWFPLVSTTFPESLASGTVPVERLDASRFVSPDPTQVTVPVVAIFCAPKFGDIFVPAIAAEAFTSASSIVPFTISALATELLAKSAAVSVPSWISLESIVLSAIKSQESHSASCCLQGYHVVLYFVLVYTILLGPYDWYFWYTITPSSTTSSIPA